MVYWGEELEESEEHMLVVSKEEELEESEENMLVVSKEQLGKVTDIIWTYIDTFGMRHKNNVYVDLEKNNPTSFNIEKLINTVNWIIYCETLDFRCNQIETANWTCFEMRNKDN